MIYAKVMLKLDFEMSIPMPGATTIDDVNAEIEKDGGKAAFIDKMSAEMVRQMESPFTTGKVTDGSMEIVQI